MGYELLFLFAPFAVLFLGVAGERIKVKYLRELAAVAASLATVYGVLNIYGLVQSSPVKIVLVSLGGAPPLGACFEIDMLGVYMAASAALLGFFATVYSVIYMKHDTRLTE